MSTDAGALHCPNCGSPAAPGDAACKYCKAALATVSCPSCFALMFEGAIYCPACGTRRARSAGGDRQAPCPACRGVMREVLVGETALLECGKCRGMWLDAATFEHVCADREAQGAVLHQWPTTQRPATAARVRYRKCVACGKMMNRLNFGRLSGTVVDVCKGHGTFLDEGELHLIVTFIQQGGLDRARQRQIEELRDEEARLRATQAMRQPGLMESTVETTSWSGRDLLSLLEHLTRR
jgi:Zn-finger nucleic acid-binding protein